MKKVDTYEIEDSKDFDTDNNAIDNAVEEAEGWEAPEVSKSSAFFTTFASKIYKDFNSGVRELYNNEARACRTARDQYGARPRIDIKIDVEERNFIMHGVDSLGISEEVFKQVIKVLGKSGNLSGNEVGQFGMGFVSYQMLTDFMVLNTWTREETEGSEYYTALCKEDLATKKIVEKEPTLDTHGTKLQMILKPNVVINEVIQTIKDCAKFSQIETNIEITNSDDDELPDQVMATEQYDSVNTWWVLNNNIRKYTHEREGIQEIQKLKGDSLYRRVKAINFIHNIAYEDDDIEFKAVLATTTNYEYDDKGKLKRAIGNVSVETGSDNRPYSYGDDEDDYKGNQTFLVGVPINTNFNSLSWDDNWLERILENCDWYVNIKNERVYKPNANRDDLERESTEAITKLLAKVIKESFKKYWLTSADDYRQTLNKPLYHSNLRSELSQRIIFDSMTNEVLDTLNDHYPTVGSQWGKSLESLIKDGKTIISLQSLRSDMMNMFVQHFKDDTLEFIRCKEHGKYDVLKQWGVIIGEEYKAEHKLKIKGAKKGKGSQTILNDKPVSLFNRHTWGGSAWGNRSWRNRKNYSSTIGEVNEQNELEPHRIIQFDNSKQNFENTKDFFNGYRYDGTRYEKGSILYCRARKGLTVDTPEQFVSWFEGKTLTTTEGDLTVRQLKQIDKDNKDIKVYYFEYGLPDKNTAEKLETVRELIKDSDHDTYKSAIIAWVDKDMMKRVGMYNGFKHGIGGYSSLKGSGLNIRGGTYSTEDSYMKIFKTILNDEFFENPHTQEVLTQGNGFETNCITRIINLHKHDKLFSNEYDRMILGIVLKAVRGGEIPNQTEETMTDILIKRLNLTGYE